jgi:hypothetical protein
MTLGWYVHHHGAGHRQRFLATQGFLGEDVVALSSLPVPASFDEHRWHQLPMDAPADDHGDATAGGALHWVPLHHPGLRARMAAVARFIDDARPDAMVVDVSVEVALYARLMGIPVIWIGQRGVRVDDPHRAVYRFARLVVPWTRALRGSTPGLPADTRYSGAFSRLDDRSVTPPSGDRRALVLIGRGGDSVSTAQIEAARAATPDWHWTRPDDADDPDVLWRALMDADVVVGTGGRNVVAEVAAARRPLVCIPQERPFGEQVDQARALQSAGLAESLPAWPRGPEWALILGRACHRDPARWALLHDGHGAQRLAHHILELSCGSR